MSLGFALTTATLAWVFPDLSGSGDRRHWLIWATALSSGLSLFIVSPSLAANKDSSAAAKVGAWLGTAGIAVGGPALLIFEIYGFNVDHLPLWEARMYRFDEQFRGQGNRESWYVALPATARKDQSVVLIRSENSPHWDGSWIGLAVTFTGSENLRRVRINEGSGVGHCFDLRRYGDYHDLEEKPCTDTHSR